VLEVQQSTLHRTNPDITAHRIVLEDLNGLYGMARDKPILVYHGRQLESLGPPATRTARRRFS